MNALSAFPGKDLTLTTNGTDLDDRTLTELARYAKLVVFSVDGMDDAFGRIRGTELKGVLESVRKLSAFRTALGKDTPRIEFQFVLSVLNAGDLPDVVDLAADTGVNTVVVSHLLPQDAANSPYVLYNRYGKPTTKTLYERVRLRAMRRGVSVLLPPLELKTERRCSFAAEDAVFVNADGNVCPCYRFSHDGTEFVFGREKRVREVSFGNVAKESLDSIWNSVSFGGFRRTLLENRYPSCPDCDLLEGCDMTSDTESDCWANSPSCADCLWARGFMRCP